MNEKDHHVMVHVFFKLRFDFNSFLFSQKYYNI